MTPEISVVMPVWRPDPAHFREAVQTVLGQTFRNFELIIVEDPSERSGRAIVQALSDPRIRYVENEVRTSQVEQYDHGLAMARGLYIAAFDADDACEPQRLEKQKAYLDARPEVGGVGCQILVIDEEGRRIGRRSYPTSPEAVRKAFRRSNPLPNPGVMFRASLVKKYGGWTAGSNGVARDYEWFSRLAADGVVFANFDEPLIRYRLHPASQTRRKIRPTLQTTIEVKKKYWSGEMNFGDRLMMLAERWMLVLPPSLVGALFRRVRIDREPAAPGGIGG